ncbi:TetR family transcriptional regulator [Leucobacter coleopterorum]|uniref:TetR family transcriptional regulator n=1 Tax=Leucobacter coleopterorum TaxID=2714933 RepID=A0ABX6K1D8_9MICO|nr:TetR/AcrR family transcriptional regulator [Leucobacter coleopterorum]QIM18915.1 TetR family transcriptional regulator [Leucobacter coleopterorum]
MTIGIESAAPLSLRDRRRQRTQTELVDAALVVIRDVGLADTTIERVSAVSGISRGTIYAHFPGGRDELLRAAYARLGSELAERTRAEVSAAEDWQAQLAAHAREMFRLAADPNIGHFYNVSGPTLIVSGVERGIGSGASAAMIRETLTAAQRSGQVDPAIDVAAVALLLVGALREAAAGVSAGQQDPHQAHAAFGILLRGLAA